MCTWCLFGCYCIANRKRKRGSVDHGSLDIEMEHMVQDGKAKRMTLSKVDSNSIEGGDGTNTAYTVPMYQV